MAADRGQRIREWALAEGFDRVGIARLEPSADGAALRRWLAEGREAGMAYMARNLDRRLDPASLLDGARSAVCVALQYHPLAGAAEPAGDLWPRVARYAGGRDYHGLMLERLRRLAVRIADAYPGAATRPYVDTGPILERELAARAGLGAVGKNTNLLHPEAGSWFLLGELLLTLDLEPDAPLADLCGSCTRCLEACPTGALPEPYLLDSRRCISYWTIEHRGAVPDAARAAMGEWVFGCDVCQEVCPLNEGAGRGDHPELGLPARRARVDLTGLLEMTRETYVEVFRGSPMKRARREGLQRNAAIAMGNRGDVRYVPALGRALESGHPLVRQHAAWALGRIGGAEAAARLRRGLAEEREAEVRAEIERAAAAAGGAPGAPFETAGESADG